MKILLNYILDKVNLLFIFILFLSTNSFSHSLLDSKDLTIYDMVDDASSITKSKFLNLSTINKKLDGKYADVRGILLFDSLSVKLNKPQFIPSVGDSMTISCRVMLGQKIIADATVQLNYFNPLGIRDSLTMRYDKASEQHISSVFFDIGGNYYFEAIASTTSKLEAYDTIRIGCFVELSIASGESSLVTNSSTSVSVQSSSMAGINSIAFDLVEDNHLIKFDELQVGSILLDDQNYGFQLLSTSKSNKQIVGLTRLENKDTYSHFIDKSIIINSKLDILHPGQTSLRLENVGFFDSFGSSIPVKTINKTFDIELSNAVLTMVSEKAYFSSRDTVSLLAELVNGSSIRSLDLAFEYDTNSVHHIKTNFFSPYNNAETASYLALTSNNGNSIDIGLTGKQTTTMLDSSSIFLSEFTVINSSSKPFYNFQARAIPVIDSADLSFSIVYDSTSIILVDSTTLSISIEPPKPQKDSTFTCHFNLDQISDLFAVAGDIYYDSEHLIFNKFIEGQLLNENGHINTTYNTLLDSANSVFSIGLTRIGDVGGVNMNETKTLFSIEFTKLTNDTTLLELGNFGLISSDGVSRIPFKVLSLSLPPVITKIQSVSKIPRQFSLSQNYPNPFNPSTRINYSIPHSGFVQLKVYDMLGRIVITLVDEYKQTGSYKVDFNASALPGGVYVYRLQSDNYAESKKLVLLK